MPDRMKFTHWALQSRRQFMAANGATWSIVTTIVIGVGQVSRLGHLDPVITTLSVLGGGITGILWALAAWELKFKAWRQRMDEYQAVREAKGLGSPEKE
jgi:hypothetical protein